MYWDSSELTKASVVVGGSKKNAISRKGYIKKIYGWKPSGDNFVLQFLRESTLHGLKYIGRLHVHTFERVFWIISVVTLSFVSLIWILQAYTKYMKNPVMVSFQPFEIALDEIPFPAVTICNVNNIRKSEAEKIEERYLAASAIDPNSDESKNTLEALGFLKSICDSSETFSSQFHYDRDQIKILNGKKGLHFGKHILSHEAQKIVDPALQNCSSMIRLCTFRDTVRPCETLFHTIFTDIGYCCIFNGMPIQLLSKHVNDHRHHNIPASRLKLWKKWNIDANILDRSKSHSKSGPPRHQRKAGMKNALSILLEPELEEYFCASYDSQGFQLLTDSPIDYPLVKEFGKGIPPDSEVFVDVRPELTMVDKNIRTLTVDSRHCYFNNEFQLDYYHYYTIKNCNTECIAKLTFKECKCAPYNMPRTHDQPICFENEYSCVHEVLTNVSLLGVKKLCPKCYPGCTQVKYDMSLSFLPIKDSPLYNELGRNDSWADKHVSIVHIYFGADSVYSRVRKLLFDSSDLIASFGGILGLFLGFSIVSVLEIFYHFVLKLFLGKRV